jgi:anti-sigma regulatory factor (Ser/Thr protein kinase)
LILDLADDDPQACTRYAVTVAPCVIAPRTVARSIGDLVAASAGAHRHDDVVLAVHEVLVDATRRDPNDPVTVRVRQYPDRIDVEVLDSDPSALDTGTGALHLAHALSDGFEDRITDAGHLVRLSYRCTSTD